MDQAPNEFRVMPPVSATRPVGTVVPLAAKPLHFPHSVISPMPHPLVGWHWSRR
jgi:hypothetical protein